MVKTLKDLYDSKIFHGRLTEEEAYGLCKVELTNHGKPQVYIWYLYEFEGKLRARIDGYRGDSEVPWLIPHFPPLQLTTSLIIHSAKSHHF